MTFKSFRDWRMLPKFMSISLVSMSVIAGVVFFYLLPVVEDKMMDGKKGATKSVVEVAYQVFADHDAEVRKGTITLEEAQRSAMSEIRRMRYSGNEYLWINDMNAKMLMHPTSQNLEGKTLIDLKDKAGFEFFRAFVKTCTDKGEGFVSYMWPKPGEKEPQPKISYVKAYQPWGWIIGSGVYVDDVKSEVSHMARNIVGAIMGAILLSLALLYSVSRHLSRSTERLIDISTRLASGDLTVRVDVTSDDEIGKLAAAFNAMGETIRGVIGNVRSGAEEVAVTAVQFNDNAENVATGMEQIAEQVSTVAAASEEMSATSREIAMNCSEAADGTKVVRQAVDEGSSIVNETVSVMNEIATQVRVAAGLVENLGNHSIQIGEIVETIEDIADQTNLLALNAAIEAARAGEQGRGFAVVADEVRALAERTTKATKEIATMIRSIQQETGNAVSIIEEGVKKVEVGTGEAARSGKALQEIQTRINDVSAQILHIATAAEQQTATVVDVSRNINSITDVVRKAADGAHDSADAASRQARLAEDLQQAVGRFRVAV